MQVHRSQMTCGFWFVTAAYIVLFCGLHGAVLRTSYWQADVRVPSTLPYLCSQTAVRTFSCLVLASLSTARSLCHSASKSDITTSLYVYILSLSQYLDRIPLWKVVCLSRKLLRHTPLAYTPDSAFYPSWNGKRSISFRAE